MTEHISILLLFNSIGKRTTTVVVLFLFSRYAHRMNTKLLWKISSLWETYYQPQQGRPLDIKGNYPNGVSRYYNRFRYVKALSFIPSEEPVFADEYGTYHGLQSCQVLEHDGKNVYVFDNHNEMLYPLVEQYTLQRKALPLVHIDAHNDDALFEGDKGVELSLDNIGVYISTTRISDFFDAVSETSLIPQIQRVTTSSTFKSFSVSTEPYILSLDIDIFGPEGDFVDIEERVRVIAKAWTHAEVVCIAMSPGFIDQSFAREVILSFINP